MPETVTIAGKKMPKNVVIVGGAVAAGVVGYAWFTSGRGDETPAPQLPEPVPEPTDDPGFSISGGGGPPGTNAEWTQKAIDYLINYGIDATALSSALGKFLDRKPLNKVEADLVRQAMAVAGIPPQFGPWVIIEETPGVITPPPPPDPTPTPVNPPPPPAQPPPATGSAPAQPASLGLLPLGGGWYGLAWPSVPGASQYRYRWETATDRSEFAYTASTQATHKWDFEDGTQFAAIVQAGNAYGWSAPTGSNNAWAR